MALHKNKLYSILFTACLLGYIWIYFISINKISENTIEVCLIKQVTNIPCPSCGSTRSVVSLLNGEFVRALYYNPFGYLIALIMFIAPVWILIDLVFRARTLFSFFLKTEFYLKKLKVLIPLTILVIMNWIWNITKGL